MKLTLKKLLLQIGGFLVSIAPILVTVGVKWGDYTSTTTRTVSLGVGGGVALILILLKATGKIPQNVKPIFRYGIALTLLFLLDPIIQDLKLLVGMAIVGEVLDMSIFSWQITKCQKQIDAGITATEVSKQQQAQTDAIVEAIREMKSGGDSTDSSGRV